MTDYLLSPLNSNGKHLFFEARGFELTDWRILYDALLRHPITAKLQFVDASSSFGVKYIYECGFSCPDGSMPCIRSVWMEKADRLVWLITAHALS